MLSWIIPTFHAAQVPMWVGLLSLSALSAYLAVYYGLFACLISSYERKLGTTHWVLYGAALWTALEWFRGFFLSGFPWGLLGYAQANFPPAVQIAEWFGVFGASAGIAAVNLTIAHYWMTKKWNAPGLVAAVLFFGANGILYIKETARSRNPGETISAAILQGNIDQYRKWDKAYVQDIFDSYRGLSDQAAAAQPKPDLVVWPETAAPGWIPNDETLLSWIRETVRRTGTYHLIGAVTSDGAKSFNSAFLFGPDGNALGRYDKIRLVPFGEFVPLQALLGRWVRVLNELGGFDSGSTGALLETPKVRFGPNICYEAIFPELIRLQARQGAQLLVNVTNDGWYLNSAAPEQHFEMNALRAVENRKFLVRAANTGLSGIFSPRGDVVARTRLMERTQLSAAVPLRNDITFYTRFGNCFAWLCAALALIGTVRALRHKENTVENA